MFLPIPTLRQGEKCNSLFCLLFQAALMRRDRRIQGQITKAFRRSENQLLKALRKRKAEVMVSTVVRAYSILLYWCWIIRSSKREKCVCHARESTGKRESVLYVI